MKSVINVNNNNNNTGFYPVFLGEDLGFSDSINVTYPEVEKMYKKQWGQFWLPEEYSFEDDRLDLMTAPKHESDVMVLNLSAQWLMDSVASRSIIEILGTFVTNNEVHQWFQAQSFFEAIHAETYSKIMRSCFDDGNQALEDAKQNLEVFNRSKKIGEVFNQTKQMAAKYELGMLDSDEDQIEIKKQLLKTMATLYALEQISFMSSFACTFALVETGRYQMIGTTVGLILKDEVLHYQGDLAVFNAMFREEGYRELFEEIREEILEIFDEVVAQEMRWSEYIFEEGRKVLGLNENLLKDYVKWVAINCYNQLQLPWDSDRFGVIPKGNPLPYMDKRIDADAVQTANQEKPSNNYRIGQVENDLGDDEWDF